MSDEKMLEEFNKLAKEFGYDLTRGYSQEYSYQTTQNVWKLWQASAAHSAARIAELEGQKERDDEAIEWATEQVEQIIKQRDELEGQIGTLLETVEYARDILAKQTGMDSVIYSLNETLFKYQRDAEEYRKRVKSEAKIGLLRDMIEDLRGTDCAYYPMDLQAIIHTIEDDELRQAEGKGEK